MDREAVRRIALSLGADAVGFCVPRVFHEWQDVLEKRVNLPFEQPDLARRIDPFLHFSQAEGVVCILKSHDLFENHLGKDEYKVTSSSLIDYHREVKGILRELQKILEENGIQSTVMCDTEGLLDKQIALDAGLGFIGKNSLLIHPKWGSAVHIGYLLTDASWEPDPPVEGSCGECTQCIDACPKGAIKKEGGLRHLLCLSGMTQNRKAAPQYLEKYLYGCDICLKACPYNEVKEREERFIYREEDFALSHREFQLQYAEMEFAWLGRNLLHRNILWNQEEDR